MTTVASPTGLSSRRWMEEFWSQTWDAVTGRHDRYEWDLQGVFGGVRSTGNGPPRSSSRSPTGTSETTSHIGSTFAPSEATEYRRAIVSASLTASGIVQEVAQVLANLGSTDTDGA